MSEEIARIKQRQFYIDAAERLMKMADEYSPEAHAANPLPIHQRTAIAIVHGDSAQNLWENFGRLGDRVEFLRDSVDITSGSGSVHAEVIHVEQTEEKYKEDLAWWSKLRKLTR